MVLLHYQGNVRPNTEYTLSLTAAMSQDKVVGLQLIEGGNDATLFENFLFKVLARLRSDPATAQRRILIVADNARIHKYERVKVLAERLKVDVLFLA